MAGDSEVGGNGSIHWRVKGGGGGGNGKDSSGGGNIRVEARYDSPGDAQTALNDAQAALNAAQAANPQAAAVVLYVRAHTPAERPTYTPGKDAQVLVSWPDKDNTSR
jgi:hypothetical protein